MKYEELFTSLGFRYLGPCACRKEQGFIYAHPTVESVELWIYPKRHKIKRKEHGETKRMLEYTDATINSVINQLAA